MKNGETANSVNSSKNLQNENSNEAMRNKLNNYNNNVNSDINNGVNSSIHNPNLSNLENRATSNNFASRRKQNDANNAEAVKAAADIASQTGHPVAAGIGKGIKIADKFSNGAASKKLGKSITKANKMVPGGRLAQALTNKAAKEGVFNKIGQAYAMKNGSASGKLGQGMNNTKPPQTGGSDLADSKKKKKQVEESYDSGTENFKISMETVKKIAIVGIPIFAVIVFMILMVSGSQVFLQANTLGQADSVNDEDAENNINNLDESKLNEEVDSDENNSNNNNDSNEDTNNVSYLNDIYIDTEKELERYEFIAKQTVNNQEASLQDLKDFYPEIVNYTSDEYNQNDVYKFFKKLYYINKYYSSQGVTLDLPLIMSVLRLQSDDMGIVFRANTEEYSKDDIEKGENNPDFNFEKDWSSYKSTRKNSAHDMEILVQGMAREGSNSSGNSDRTLSKTGKEAVDKMNEIVLQQADEVHEGGQKYWSWYGFSYRDEWCAMFVSWLFDQIGGLDKYIKSSAIAGGIVRDSTNAGYGTWHEDECTDPSTVPQPGDVIVFDPWVGGTYLPYPDHGEDKFYSSHVGYVYKVDDTYVYTVEGNSSDSVRRREYNRKTHCGTAGIQGINGYFRPNY